ncbi:unnamed protein product, partial [Symbiodinium necroappetens]
DQHMELTSAESQASGHATTTKGDTEVDGREGQGRRQKDDEWYQENWGIHSLSNYQLRELCGMMARLLLRHSDQMAINRCEAGFMMFLQAQGMLSLVADLYQVAQVWKKAREDAPETINLPLRVVMFKHIIDVLLSRLEACQATEASLQEAQQML